MDQLKQDIQAQLLTKTGKINSAILRRDWFKTSNIANRIHEATNFLDHLEPSVSMRILCILQDITAIPLCVICGDPCCYNKHKFNGFSKTCNNRSCAGKAAAGQVAETKVTKYGNIHSPEWVKSMNERDKTAHALMLKEAFKAKYGVSSTHEVPGIVEKRRATMLTRYGVDGFWKVNQDEKAAIKRDDQRRALEQLGDITIEEVYTTSGAQRVVFSCNGCDATHDVSVGAIRWRSVNAPSVCPKCGNFEKGSIQEQQIADFIIGMLPGDDIRRQDRSVLKTINRELDIYIPARSLAFEYNGMFWHSYDKIETPQEKKSHLRKTIECAEQGIQLIHIFEYEWLYKRPIVESRIKSLIGASSQIIGARKTKVVELTKKEHQEFMDHNHLQGRCGCQVALGLMYNNEIVAAMSFGKSRFNKNIEWELLRFAVKRDTSVPGGASKLFSAFVKQNNPTSVISYADRRWSEGKLYSMIGFEACGASAPNYYYLKYPDLVPESRQKYQKHKLHNLLDAFDSTLSEPQNMFANNYRRIWDCGNLVFKWYKK